jgi:DNA polymerase I
MCKGLKARREDLREQRKADCGLNGAAWALRLRVVATMEAGTFQGPSDPTTSIEDAWLFGSDPTPGIVSVYANREGTALVWRREGGQILFERVRYRPWLYAASLADLAHVKASVHPVTAGGAGTALVTYRVLDGPEGSLRYLLTASDGRKLERLLLEGASRRLGRQITSLNDLPGEYYRVGPVEQYLMQSGRVYFRGLAYEDLLRLQVDLETTSLNPQRGRIFLAAIQDSSGFSTILEAQTPADEKQLILDLCATIRGRDPDTVENHNITFDLSFLEARAAVYGVQLALGRKGGPALLERHEERIGYGRGDRRVRYSLAGREIVDTLDAVRRYDFSARALPSYRLKDVARYFGIASPERVYLEGAKIFETYQRDPDLVRHYALDDVTEVDGLSRRLMGAPFALAGMAPRRYERLVSAGPATGVLEPILVRAYLQAGEALPGPASGQGIGQDLIEGGAVFLFAEGVAEHVVKTDVASLYPSIMTTERIGPSSDRLGVLLSILGRLTDLRLAHKAAAKAAPPGSLEASHHEATQAAMKVLINAAYGYMGAGHIALFADTRAAAEVTRRGREILTQVVEGLRRRGMTLIEADTDGVYFTVPEEFDEEQERAVVAAVAAELPAGIRLEYETRLRSFLSHEVKNYAAITYAGQLIVRGAALRSSRAEPYGDRFLRQALLCVMTGDVGGVRDAFLETVEALRTRSLPASDLATRVRLSKTLKEYMAVRQRHQEPQYEALLSAGRTSWEPGERVRFYRTRSGAFVWLPDEQEEASAVLDSEDEAEEEDTMPMYAAARAPQETMDDRRDYDVEYYLQQLASSYTARLRKAFEPEDYAQLFRIDGQTGLFDRPLETIQPKWIRCTLDPSKEQA